MDKRVKRIDGVKDRFRKKGFNLKREAEEWLKYKEDIFFNFKDEPLKKNKHHDITFEELIDKYFEHNQHLRKTTLKSYRERINRYKKLYNLKAEAITTYQLSIITNEMIKNGLAENTIKNTQIIAKAVFTFGQDVLDLSNDPLKKIKLYKDHNQMQDIEIEYYTLGEFKKFISVFENNSIYRLLYIILFYTGARVGEAKALTWKDIDLKQRKMLIKKSLDGKEQDTSYVITPTKGKKRRTLTIPIPLLKELERHLSHERNKIGFNSDWFVLGGIKHLKETTYTTHKDNAVDIYNSKIRKSNEEELKRITTHDFRHSFACLTINSGIDLKTLCDLMGHASYATTERYYAQLYPETLSNAMFKLDEKYF